MLFNKNFYPTPRHVLDRMGIDCYDKIVLEPSAGKGDIIDYCKEFGAKEVLACEINEDLQKIIHHKGRFIGSDFFNVTSEQISHVELIVMNPPFDKAAKHILHAWQIAPEGCEIIALCNWETLDNRYSYSRTELGQLVTEYGNKENLEDCFIDAERKTNVQVGVVHLFKPIVSDNFNYDGFYFTDDETQGQNGIMPYNDVRAIVNSYVAAVKCFDKVQSVANELSSYTKVTGFRGGFVCNISSDKSVYTREDFAKEMQKHCWKHVFNKLGVEKIVTTGVMQDINKFVESRLAYPFTMRNIFRMMEIIIGTREQIMQRAIVEAVDNFTKHTHENRYGVEGWKTNEGHLLNFKFIANNVAGFEFGNNLRVRTYNSRQVDFIIDLFKALSYVTGTDFEAIPTVYQINALKLQPNTWYDWGFFQFKVFKKGTGHFKFKDPKVWELLNRSYAKAKGQVLPENLKTAA